MPAAGEIHRLKKRRLPAGFLAGDESVKHNGHFNPSLSRLNLIFSWQPNFLATTLHSFPIWTILKEIKAVEGSIMIMIPISFNKIINDFLRVLASILGKIYPESWRDMRTS